MSKSLSTTLRRVCLAVMTLCGMASLANAQDLGELELGVKYTLEQYKPVSGTFTAPKSGELIVNGGVPVWSNKSHTNLIEGNFLDFTNGGVYQYDVVEGKTYYLYQDFNFNAEYLLLEMDKVLAVEQTFPDRRDAISSAGYDYVDVWFNQHVTVENATIAVGTTSVNVDVMISNNKIVSIPFIDVFSVWYEDGTLVGGEDVVFTLHGVADSKGNLYNGDGVFSITYKAGKKPLELQSSKIPSTVYSYYLNGDEAALVSLTFNGELSTTKKMTLTLVYGNPDSQIDMVYTEQILGVVDGNTITFDLAGKTRNPKDMVESGTNYRKMTLEIGPIYAADGANVKGGGPGTIGTFSYEVGYTPLEFVEVVGQFSPENGASIRNADEIEIWVRGISTLIWDGVSINYEVNGAKKSTLVAKSALTVEEVDDEATIVVPLTDEIRNAANVEVTLNIQASKDGYDHSGAVKALYNGFVVTYSYPANGAELAELEAGSDIVVRLNVKDAYVGYSINDMDAENVAESLLATGVMTLQENGTYKTTIEKALKLYVGHTYQLNVTGYASEEDMLEGVSSIGTGIVTWSGTSLPNLYSPVELVSVDPEMGTVLTSIEMNVVTLTYDGLVMIADNESYIDNDGEKIEFESIEGIDAAETEGFANTWVLTIPQSYLESLNGVLKLVVKAYDTGALSLRGNAGDDYNSYLVLEYDTRINVVEVTVSPAADSVVSELSTFYFSVKGSNVAFSLAEMPFEAGIYNRNRELVAEYTKAVVLGPSHEENPSSNAIVKMEFEPITEEGIYMLQVPAGFFLIGEDRKPSAEVFNVYEVGTETPAGALAVYPQSGVEEELYYLLVMAEGLELNTACEEKIVLYNYGLSPDGVLLEIGTDYANAGVSEGMYYVEFDQTYSEPGTYFVVIPEGFFLVNGQPCAETEVSWDIEEKGPRATQPLSVTPGEGSVSIDDLARVVISADGKDIGTNWEGVEMTLTNAAGDVLLTLTSEDVMGNGMYAEDSTSEWDPYVAYWVNLADALADQPDGEYTLLIPEAFFIVGWEVNETTTVVYNVSHVSGIATIVDDAGQGYNVYTINGVNVVAGGTAADIQSLKPGLYIINGKKVLVRK